MASFAKIGLNGKVIAVHSVVNEVLHDSNGIEREDIGIDFLTKLHGWSSLETNILQYNRWSSFKRWYTI
jgi:hypothetical protein